MLPYHLAVAVECYTAVRTCRITHGVAAVEPCDH